MKKLGKLTIFFAILVVMVGCSNNGGKKEVTGESSGDSKQVSKVLFSGDDLIEAEEVAATRDEVILVDCRGEDNAKKGTIEGATAIAWQGLSDVESVKQGDYQWGLVYQAPELAKRLGEAGLSKEANLVLFSDGVDGWGEDGRILWTLKQAGYTKAKMVDGGLMALKEAGLKSTKKVTKLAPVEGKSQSLDKSHSIETKELEANLKDYKLVDVRSKEEFKGATKYGEAKGGHLPEAINLAYTDLFQETGYLKSNEAIEKLAKEAGLEKDDKIVTYCTGGIRSAYMELILSSIGYNQVKNYDGSYYTWSANNEVQK